MNCLQRKGLEEIEDAFIFKNKKSGGIIQKVKKLW